MWVNTEQSATWGDSCVGEFFMMWCFPSFLFVRTSIYFLIPIYQDYLNTLFPAKVSVDYILSCTSLLDYYTWNSISLFHSAAQILPCLLVLQGPPEACFSDHPFRLSHNGPSFSIWIFVPFLFLFILNSFPILTLALLLSLDTHQIQMKPHTTPCGVHMVNTWLKTRLKIHPVPEICCD